MFGSGANFWNPLLELHLKDISNNEKPLCPPPMSDRNTYKVTFILTNQWLFAFLHFPYHTAAWAANTTFELTSLTYYYLIFFLTSLDTPLIFIIFFISSLLKLQRWTFISKYFLSLPLAPLPYSFSLFASALVLITTLLWVSTLIFIEENSHISPFIEC